MRSGRDGGFTLLELLISALLISMIVLAAAGAMRLGLKSVEKGENKIMQHERVRAVLDIMDAQLQSEVPLQYDDDQGRRFHFRGDRWSLHFPSSHSVRGGRSGCLLVAYQVFSETGGPGVPGRSALYVYEKLMGMEDWSNARLLDKIDYAGFEYFSPNPANEEEGWTYEWNEPAALPEKIRISLRVDGRDLTRVFPVRARSPLSRKEAVQDGSAKKKAALQ
ncbi:MAG: prepilin-type N-terminal cleavage/methylation domain-containing protein [Syntrophaceae bacterium]